MHSSCEIEYFVETHLCKLCDTYTSKYIVYMIITPEYFFIVRSSFFLSRPQLLYEILGLEFLGQIASFERRLRGEGLNAPRPALSVLHLDVNADRR